MKRFLPCVAGLLLITGCTVGPNYRRPDLPLPSEFRGETTVAVQPASTRFGDLKWFEVFQDAVLQRLIETAAANNYDVRLAAQRVLEARAGVTLANSALYPRLDGMYRWENRRLSRVGLTAAPPGFDRDRSANFLSANLAWEVDFWGRIRRAIEAANAAFLASEENHKFVMLTLVADLAGAYFLLVELDRELDISRRTLQSRQASLQLIEARLKEGVANQLELDQAAVLVHDAARRIPDLERRINEQENLINLLLGRAPGPVSRGDPLPMQRIDAEVPMGIPSSLLTRRPDIRAAEEELIAANARLGEARAAYFPEVNLVASYGGEAEDISEIFDAEARTWLLGPTVTVPLFTAGRLGAQVKQAEARTQQALLRYGQTIQQAFREVGDALVGIRKTREFRQEQQKLVDTLQDQIRLSQARYIGGVTTYLEVLDTERQSFVSQLELAQAKLDELLAMVSLYRALGGGWQE